MERRIFNSQDINYFFDHLEIGKESSEGSLYYDPCVEEYYEEDGSSFNPHNYFSTIWFEDVIFRYINGEQVLIPEQKSHQVQEPNWKQTSDEQITNFLVPGFMATCGKTKFNEGGHAFVSWEHQQPCSFSVSSVVAKRCMFWKSELDGVCDCHLAFIHKSGAKVDLTRIKEMNHRDHIADLKPDHHFEKAKEIGTSTLSDWYQQSRLLMLKTATKGTDSVFYDPHWDIYWNGHGDFLEKITTARRKTDADCQEHLKNWRGEIE